MFPFPSFCPSERPPLIVDFLGTQTRNSNGNSQTWSGVPLGDPHPSRIIALTITNAGTSTARTVTSSVGGVGGVEVANSTNDFAFAAIHIAAVPLGTTGDIAVNYSAASVNQIAIGVYRIIGMTQAQAYDASGADDNSPLGLVVNVPRGGAVIAAARASANVSTIWTGIDEDYDFTLSNSVTQMHSGAHKAFTEAQSALAVSVARSTAGNIRACVASFR